jgi:hypothetical protein
MAKSPVEPKPYELRVAGLACIVTISVLTALMLLAPVPRIFVLSLAYFGLIASTAYGLNRFYAFSTVGDRRSVQDPDYFADPDLFLLAVATPPMLYMCFELRAFIPTHHDWAYMIVYFIIVVTFVLAILGLVVIPLRSFDLFSWLSVPLSLGTFVLLLGDSKLFGFFSHMVPNQIFDTVEASRWILGCVIGVAILAQTAVALLSKSGDFVDIARRWSSLRLLTQAASTATGLYRAAVSVTILFLTIGKYVLMAMELSWLFFFTIAEALFNALRSFLNWRRLIVSASAALLILSGILIAHDAPVYIGELDQSLATTRYDTELFFRFCTFVAWVAVLGLVHALIGYRRREELISSVVLIVTMVACGAWVGAFVFRTLSTFGAIDAGGFALSDPSWFFLLVLIVAPLGGIVAWWHVANSRTTVPTVGGGASRDPGKSPSADKEETKPKRPPTYMPLSESFDSTVGRAREPKPRA